MSLTRNDLQQIRTVVTEVIDEKVPDIIYRLVPGIVDERLKLQLEPLEGEIEALSNDVKELYSVVA